MDGHGPLRELEVWSCQRTLKEGSCEALVEGSDRKHVEPQKYCSADGDARTTVRLEITDIEADKFGKSKTAYGSGVAIGFDVVLTAAHNLRCSANSPDRIHRALTVKLCLGFHDNGNPHPTAVETRYGSICAVLREWAHGHEYEFNDMAIIKLDHPFKVLKPAKYSAPPLGPLEVRILEYPGDNREQVISRCENAKVAGCMYEVKGSATYDRERKVVEFALSTMGGNSGGPVFLGDHATVVATHTGRDLYKNFNFATPVDEDFINTAIASVECQPNPKAGERAWRTMVLDNGTWICMSNSTVPVTWTGPAMPIRSVAEAYCSGRYAGQSAVTSAYAKGHHRLVCDGREEKQCTIRMISVRELKDGNDNEDYVIINASDVEDEGGSCAHIPFAVFPLASYKFRRLKRTALGPRC